MTIKTEIERLTERAEFAEAECIRLQEIIDKREAEDMRLGWPVEESVEECIRKHLRVVVDTHSGNFEVNLTWDGQPFSSSSTER